MRAEIPGRSLRTLHSLAKMWTFGHLELFSFKSSPFVCFPVALWTALCVLAEALGSTPKDMFSCAVSEVNAPMLLSGVFGGGLGENCG